MKRSQNGLECETSLVGVGSSFPFNVLVSILADFLEYDGIMNHKRRGSDITNMEKMKSMKKGKYSCMRHKSQIGRAHV